MRFHGSLYCAQQAVAAVQCDVNEAFALLHPQDAAGAGCRRRLEPPDPGAVDAPAAPAANPRRPIAVASAAALRGGALDAAARPGAALFTHS